MRYFIGPWQWNGGDMPHYSGPPSAIGQIDYGTLPEQSVGNTTRRGCLCWTDGSPLPSEYVELGNGDMRELKTDARMISRLESHLGHRPQGDTLADLLLDHFTRGSDPDGQSACCPIQPNSHGWLELAVHGNCKSERFEWGRSSHTGKIQAALRSAFRGYMDDAEKGRLKDKEQHRRILDAWCEKYCVDDWKQFVPTALQKHVPGRLPHETTISESFNKTDSATLGPDLSWTELKGDQSVVSNACELATNDASFGARARADSDLSSADHYAQCTLLNPSSSAGTWSIAVFARKDSSATHTFYQCDWLDLSGTQSWRTFKWVAGVATGIGSSTTATASNNDVLKVECNGSTIGRYVNGSLQNAAVDTAIPGNVRCGVGAYWTSGTKPRLDAFSASDLVSSGMLYTQLERSTRGVSRGIYMRF